ncbi:hypothetical protein OROGR_005992 [Orobanche gracilis]
MKRVNEFVSGDGESSGLKKVRFSNGNGKTCAASDRNYQQRVYVENGGMDNGKVGKNGDPFEDIVSDDLEGFSFGGLNEYNLWDFDVKFDLIFGDGEEQKKGLVFDLNLPAYRIQNGGPVINEKKVDVIDIASDDSNDEVEVIGYTCGYNNAKGKEIDIGMFYDGVENLNLGLGMIGMNNVVGESSIDGVRRFTKEEKGKTNVVDSWFSLKANSPTGLYLLTNNDESTESGEPMEGDVDNGIWQLIDLHGRSEMAERAIAEAEEAVRYRQREALRETAKRYARINLPDKNSAKESSSLKQQSPTVSPIEQLGKASGPFTDALRVVRERSSKRAARQLIEWKSLRENQNRSITAPFVPSLLDLSLKALAENAEGCPTEIRVKNCSWLTEKQCLQTFGNFDTKDLRVLQLDLCGQCMLDFAFRDIICNSSNSFSSLAILSLRGACRLTDSGLKTLIMAAPLLRSINLGQCTLLTSNTINFIADFLGSNLRELYIDECHKVNPMPILPAFNKFKYLEVLSVAGMHSITDQFIAEVLAVCGQSIKELGLADCLNLTDCCLKTIGSNCADLWSLNISNVPNLTDVGLECLANGCQSIRKLKMCRNEFSDEAMAAYIESSGESLTELLLNHMTKVGPNTALSLAKHSRKLLSLDISFCRLITNEALGLIVDSCSSLKLLKIFGCRQITNVFLNGYSNPDVRIIGLNLTPFLDHVNLLEPEGVLLCYSPLPNSQ